MQVLSAVSHSNNNQLVPNGTPCKAERLEHSQSLQSLGVLL